MNREQAASARQPAAVDRQNVAVDVVARAGSEEDDRADEVFGRAPASGGYALRNLTAARRVGAMDP